MVVGEDVSDAAPLHQNHGRAVSERVFLVLSRLIQRECLLKELARQRRCFVPAAINHVAGEDGYLSPPEPAVCREERQQLNENSVVCHKVRDAQRIGESHRSDVLRINLAKTGDEKPCVDEVRRHYFAVARCRTPYTTSSTESAVGRLRKASSGAAFVLRDIASARSPIVVSCGR